MTLPEATLEAIRADLIAGIDRHNRRRRHRPRVAALAILAASVAVIATAALVFTGDNATAAHTVTAQPDGTIRIEVFPDFGDVTALETDLAAVGLDTVVIALRAHPSLQGVVEVVSHTNTGSGALAFDDGQFEIHPDQVSGEIEILIYSPTPAGERYQAAPSIFAPGQPLAGLHCAYPDRPLPATELAERLDNTELDTIEWTVIDRDPTNERIDASEHTTPPDGNVLDAQQRDPHTVAVFVTTNTPGPSAATSITMHDGTHYGPRPACTPELANPWQ